MGPELLAGVAAVLFAGSHIASKRGMQDTSVISGLLISLLTGWLVLIATVLVDPPGEISLTALWILIVAGAVAPALGRAGAIAGVARLGPSVSVPIQASVYPLFAVTAAFLFLGETAGVPRIVGVAAIMIGVWILARRGAEPTAPDLDVLPEERSLARTRTPAFAFPVIAGLAYGGATSSGNRRSSGSRIPPSAQWSRWGRQPSSGSSQRRSCRESGRVCAPGPNRDGSR